MYTVLLDSAYLYHPSLDGYELTEPELNLEVNTSGSLQFTIYPSHPLFGAIKRLKSVVEVYDDGELIFRGRPLNDTYKIDKSQTILCEGDLAFLNDTQMPLYSHTGSIEDLLTKYINNHNSQATSDRQFTLGYVTVTDPNNTIVRSSINYVNTWQEVKSKLIDSLGGYIRVRRLGDVNYIDYLHDSPTISGQSIELTKNMLDYQQTIDVSDIATVIIPLGAKLKDEEGNELDERLTIGSVNGGKDYIEHTAGISKYGKIWTVQVWDDVTTPQILKDRGTSSLNTLVNLGVNIEIKAIDLNLIDKTESKLRFFDYVRIISKPHEVDEEMLIKKQTINLNDPSQNVITVGTQFATFTEKQLRNENIIKLIESNYVTNETVGEIRQLTTILQSSITQTAEEIRLEVLERQETDRVLSEKISEIDVDISSIRLEVSQIGGYNIISNPIGRFGTLDWTFESEHIKAYANAPYNKAYEVAPYLKAQADNGSIMVGVETDTKAKYGFRVWKSGKALSKITPAESGSDYSLHTKVKGDAVLRFKLREYTSATPTSKDSFLKETLLNTTNPTVEYSTYEKTVTLDNTTQSVVLVVESDVSSRDGQFALFTNTSFNIGQPKPYGESITDMNNRIDNINARVTIAEDTVDLFTSRVNTVEGQVHTNTAQLTVQAGEISSKVNTNGVISAINQTAETIKINANKINLTGYVTVSSLSGQDTTTIDGSNIKTGTISADRINFNGATGTNVDLTGTITATSGKIGGFTIGSRLTSGSGTSAITISGVDGTGFIWAGSSDFSSSPFRVTRAGGVVATSATITGTSSGTGQFSAGYHNNGSFSYGSFGGTVNSPSGTLGATAFSSTTNGISFAGSITGGHRYPGAYNTSDIGITDRPFRTIYYATALTKVSDIRLKDDFENIDNEFNEFVYSLPIGSYTLKGSDNPQLGINANLVDNLFPDEVTKYLINQDERGYYSANYEALVPMLVKVVQEQHHRLIDLEWRMSEMERMMA